MILLATFFVLCAAALGWTSPRVLAALERRYGTYPVLFGWAASVLAFLGLIVVGVAVMAWPNESRPEGLIEASARCLGALVHSAPSATQSLLLAVGAFVAGIATTRCLSRLRRLRAQRAVIGQHHREVIALIAVPADFEGVVVLDHPLPIAYSVYGKPAHIVLTAGLIERLDDNELHAVVEHERAHLARKHHLIASVCELLAAAAPVPVLRQIPAEVSALLECDADHVAARVTSRHSVRSALISLCHASPPQPAVGDRSAQPAHSGSYQRRLGNLTPSPRRVPAIGYVACVCLPLMVAVALAVTAVAGAGVTAHLSMT